MEFLTRKEVDPRIWTDCKLFYFLFNFWRHYSSVILVLMSIEKCFAVYFPLKSKTVCTVRTAKWATGTVGVVLVGINLHWFITIKSQMSSGHHICVTTDHYHYAFETIDSVLYSFGPFTLMFVTNFAIAFKFLRAKCRSANETESTNQALAKAATRGTAMVVTVSVTFLILTTPTAVYMVLLYVIDLANYPLYRVFINFTQYLNHSINGVLYCIVGSKFRNELLKILCRNNRPDSHSVNNMSLATISGTRA